MFDLLLALCSLKKEKKRIKKQVRDEAVKFPAPRVVCFQTFKEMVGRGPNANGGSDLGDNLSVFEFQKYLKRERGGLSLFPPRETRS
jgi:hypothetical protein